MGGGAICDHNKYINSKHLIPGAQQFPKNCDSKILFWKFVITEVKVSSGVFEKFWE